MEVTQYPEAFGFTPFESALINEPSLREWCEDLALSRMQMELWRAVACRYPHCETLTEWSMAEDRVKTLEKCVKEMAS